MTVLRPEPCPPLAVETGMKQIALLAMLPLAACYPATVEPSEPAGSYRALGTEPFWSVTVENGTMTYDTPEGGFAVPAPAPRTTFNGHRYETERLTMDVTHGQCSDGMSDRIYADTVTVSADGRELKGCGGVILPPAELAGTSWAITAIDGVAVSGDGYFLTFTGDRLNGKAGCNGFSGTYRMNGRTLTPGPIAATKMACPGERMEHEAKAFAILDGSVEADFPDGDTMMLRSPDGALTLRRSI